MSYSIEPFNLHLSFFLGEGNFKILNFQFFFAISSHCRSAYSSLSLIILCFETFPVALLHNIHNVLFQSSVT